MSEHSQDAPTGAAPGGSLAMIRALTLVAAISGALIVVVYQWTLPTIKANRAAALRQAVFDVLPKAQRLVTFKLQADGTLVPLEGQDEKAVKFYAGYDGDRLDGVAIVARGQGFQDVIQVIYGYAPDLQTIIGMKVLDSKETPGLGDKIGHDPAFLANFKDLDVRLSDDGKHLVHQIQVVKHGTKTHKWQIDAITGATISSKAVGRLLDASVQARLPVVRRNLDRLKEGK